VLAYPSSSSTDSMAILDSKPQLNLSMGFEVARRLDLLYLIPFVLGFLGCNPKLKLQIVQLHSVCSSLKVVEAVKSRRI
jgi:hypothetical protein